VALNGQRIIYFSPVNGMGKDFFVHKRIVSVIRRVEFISDRMSYILLRGHKCSFIVLNVHSRCEDKSDDVKYNFYEVLGRIFDQFPMYVKKISLVDCIAKVGREDIFKQPIGNEFTRN
jgi:hypothetical protein